MNTVLYPQGVSLLIAPMLPSVPSPTTPPFRSGHLILHPRFRLPGTAGQGTQPPPERQEAAEGISHAGHDRGFAQP